MKFLQKILLYWLILCGILFNAAIIYNFVMRYIPIIQNKIDLLFK